MQAKKTGPRAGFSYQRELIPAYWLAPEAGAAADAPASEAGAAAADAASLAAAAVLDAASEAAAAADEAAEAAADASLAADEAAWSELLLQAASATAANSEATRRDFFMITSFYG
ncbi:hypothetical protein [Burkholderia gladioli]|uniref:hypothetical protein n=1 Tax=Burkholderia gladioli TaxID=28095 RepID=UPI001CC7CC66|nr:hypothetical protein [Burkholderia gladioli]